MSTWTSELNIYHISAILTFTALPQTCCPRNGAGAGARRTRPNFPRRKGGRSSSCASLVRVTKHRLHRKNHNWKCSSYPNWPLAILLRSQILRDSFVKHVVDSISFNLQSKLLLLSHDRISITVSMLQSPPIYIMQRAYASGCWCMQ